MPKFAGVVAAIVAAGWCTTGAAASNLIVESVRSVRLAVSTDAAVITYVQNGAARTALAYGAVNARTPHPRLPQAGFRVVYGGSRGGLSCPRYRGPRLPWLVSACTARDGSHWAVQSWQRRLPNYGLRARPEQAVWEVRLSHWKGPLYSFVVKTDWTYRQFDHLYGALTYLGQPMHGFGTTRYGAPTDTYGVLVYLDTFNSAYGRGWKRENSFVTHKPSGIFCYGFFPHGIRPSGKGTHYRATVVGPGVLPDLMWQGKAPGQYDPKRDERANLEQERFFSDRLCRPN